MPAAFAANMAIILLSVPALGGLKNMDFTYDAHVFAFAWSAQWRFGSSLAFNLSERNEFNDKLSMQWTSFNIQSMGDPVPWQAGRSPLALGTGHYDSTILNHDIPGFDILRYSFTFWGIEYDKFAAFLDGKDRILFGHRFGGDFFQGRLELHAQELCLAAGEYDSLFNNPLPFVPYYLLQHVFLQEKELNNANINIMWAFDWKYKMPDTSQIYGEIFIDDLKSPFDADDRTVPTRLAGLIGYGKPDLFVQKDVFRFEYARANRFTYSHWQPGTDFILDGECMGHGMGSDADNLTLEYRFPAGSGRMLGIKCQYERHGEGEIGDRWDHTMPPLQFLTGIVEIRRVFDIGYYVSSGRGEFYFLGSAGTIANQDHSPGAEDVIAYIKTGLTVKL